MKCFWCWGDGNFNEMGDGNFNEMFSHLVNNTYIYITYDQFDKARCIYITYGPSVLMLDFILTLLATLNTKHFCFSS
jgi:hypothetical protein